MKRREQLQPPVEARALTAADLDAIERLLRRIVREEIANATRSRKGSPIGIGARDQGDLECDERERNEYMDPTTEDTEGSGGASSSLEQTVDRLLSRSRQRQKLKPLSISHARRSKAAP